MKNRNITFTTILLMIACCALSPKVQAVVPTPDGGYPGGNTAEGQNALLSLSTGTYNTAVGIFSLLSLTDGSFCTGVGAGTLLANTGDQITATGAGALFSNTTGGLNTANGAFALFSNTEGGANTATGGNALLSNTTGSDNTATGAFALSNNTTAIANTATGEGALFSNDTGEFNTASGMQALFTNTTGSDNTATGFKALLTNTTGGGNTASGTQALFSNTTGNSNTAIGGGALFNNTTGSVNVAVGDFAGGNLTTGDVNIDILNPGVAGETNTIRIGVTQTRTFIAGIFGTNVSGSTVVVNSDGQLGVAASSRRFKREIKPIDEASEAILALRPVTFHYKSDTTNTAQFGLIAEEVAEVNADLVVRDENGEIYTVRYDAVNAMLLNEFLIAHRKAQLQEATITQLKSTIAQQQKRFESKLAEQDKQIEALASGLQKVSAQLEVSKPAPQMVANDQ